MKASLTHWNAGAPVSLPSVLGVAGFLLRDGGLACCDFFYATSFDQPGRRDAKAPADPDNPSSGFHYTDDEVEALVAQCGYQIVSSEIVESEFRRFVLMRKLPSACPADPHGPPIARTMFSKMALCPASLGCRPSVVKLSPERLMRAVIS